MDKPANHAHVNVNVGDEYPPSRPGIKTYVAVAVAVLLLVLGFMGVFD